VAFKVYDIDGNGFIERHELLKLAEAIHKARVLASHSFDL
jgi:Ca2+-binding EF-hand superfamily protein